MDLATAFKGWDGFPANRILHEANEPKGFQRMDKKEKLTDIGFGFLLDMDLNKNLLDGFQDIGRIDIVSINF